MKVKLFDDSGNLVYEGNVDKNDRPNVIVLNNRDIFVADPRTFHRGDEWWRYSIAWPTYIHTNPIRPEANDE